VSLRRINGYQSAASTKISNKKNLPNTIFSASAPIINNTSAPATPIVTTANAKQAKMRLIVLKSDDKFSTAYMRHPGSPSILRRQLSNFLE